MIEIALGIAVFYFGCVALAFVISFIGAMLK